jgi:hypothetical protein
MAYRIERHYSGFNPDDYPDELERLEALKLSSKPNDGFYPSRTHPLWEGFTSPDPKLTPEQWQEQNDGTIVPTARRLRAAFDGSGVTLDEWAARCSNHGTSRNVARRWLVSPSIMERSEVMATCELFGCSLEYLQGREWDMQDVASVYQSLDTEDRVRVCRLLSDLDMKRL